MENELRLIINLFEKKVEQLEESYKERNKENFNEDKMKNYINRKLKREIQIINYCNIMPSIRVLNSESFKY